MLTITNPPVNKRATLNAEIPSTVWINILHQIVDKLGASAPPPQMTFTFYPVDNFIPENNKLCKIIIWIYIYFNILTQLI